MWSNGTSETPRYVGAMMNWIPMIASGAVTLYKLLMALPTTQISSNSPSKEREAVPMQGQRPVIEISSHDFSKLLISCAVPLTSLILINVLLIWNLKAKVSDSNMDLGQFPNG